MQNFAAELFSVFLALLIVLVMAWIVLRILKRTQSGKSSDHTLRFLRTLAVGTRERVVLIRYRDKEYLLGVTPGGINLLDKTCCNRKTGKQQTDTTACRQQRTDINPK